jgi:hypothetical protein
MPCKTLVSKSRSLSWKRPESAASSARYGGKHPQLRWRVNGGALLIYAVPGTPSDVRSPLNVHADIRRLLRADGVAVGPEKTEQPPPPRKPDRITELEHRVAALEQAIAKLKSNTSGASDA